MENEFTEFNTKKGYTLKLWHYKRGLVEIFRPDGSLYWSGHYDKRYGEPVNRVLDWMSYIDSDKFKDDDKEAK